MTRLRPLVLLGAFVPLAAAACTSTFVRKDPGQHDRGIRFYRPKPYLLVEPAAGVSNDLVVMSLAYLPDFSEEYSIHVRAGFGVNKTKITLEDGWKLTQLDVDVDSKTSENITAIAGLIESIGGLIPAARAFGPSDKACIKASNVPLGYYESVISPGPDGRKRLYGWRYVGFAPFAACPQQGTGADCLDCQSLYGLVFESGAMVFKPLAAAAAPNVERDPGCAGIDPTVVPADVQTLVVKFFSGLLQPPPDASKFRFGVEVLEKKYTAAPALTADQVNALIGTQRAESAADAEAKISQALTDELKRVDRYRNQNYRIQITFPK